jgi:hypothetical protein
MFIGAKLNEVYTSAQLTGSESGSVPAPGDIVFDRGGKAYKFVQYDSGAGPVAAVAGNVAYYYAPGGVSAGSTTVVTSDLSDSANLGAGVLMSAPADGEYCWIQIKGPATITPALAAGGDGQALTAAGATDGTLDVSAAATDAVVAYAVDATAKIILCDFPF